MQQSDMYKEAMETMRHLIEAETRGEFYESTKTESIKEISKQGQVMTKLIKFINIPIVAWILGYIIGLVNALIVLSK